MRKFFRKIRLVLYWCLPPLILYIIFKRIDFEYLLDLVFRANSSLIFIGIAFIFLKIVIGALRWYFLTKSYGCTLLSLRMSIVKYWLSLTIGVVVPGSLGSDAYRVALSGQQTGRYIRGAFVIGIEKFTALVSCAILIASLYPFLLFKSLPDPILYTLNTAYVFLILSFVIILFVVFSYRTQFFKKLANTFAQKVLDFAVQIERKIRREPFREATSDRPPLELFMSAFKLSVALPTLSFSFALHIVAALQSQIFFQALGYDLPFLVNLFVAPLIMLAFTLPISFGGIGIREGVFILFYGAFGVPAETALLVSFCALSSVLLGHAMGALLIFTQRCRPEKLGKPVNNPIREK